MTSLSNQILALYDPFRDPFGEVAWRELKYASPTIKAAWMEHHFHWTSAAKEAAEQLALRGRNVTIELDLTGVQPNGQGENRLAEIETLMTIHRPRIRPMVIEENWSDESFGQVVFFVGNSGRLADYVTNILDN